MPLIFVVKSYDGEKLIEMRNVSTIDNKTGSRLEGSHRMTCMNARFWEPSGKGALEGSQRKSI